MKRIIFKNKKTIFIFNPDSIIYMEKNLRRIILYSYDVKCSTYGKFDEHIPNLDERFMMCHRSYIINMDKITEMGDNQIKLVNGDVIYLGNKSFVRAKKQLLAYMEEKNCKKTII